MNGHRHGAAATDFWHAFLLLAFSAAVSAGLGGAAHVFLTSEGIPFSAFLGGGAVGAVFCLFVFLRTRRENASKTKRAGPAVPFPRFALNLVRHGVLTGAAAILGLLTWTGIEEIVFGRPLADPVEIGLGLFASFCVGLTAFSFLLRLLESD
jgi:hypothetical protein